VKLVLLTGDGPEHRYVANRLEGTVGLAAIFVDEGKPLTAAERRAQVRRRYTWSQLADRGARRVALCLLGDASQRRRQLDDVLGSDSRDWANGGLVRRVQGINGDDARAQIQAAEPDRLLVYGTGIVGSRVLALSSLTPLNMHTGWSPTYRGSNCAFWPLFDRRLDLLGATVHEVTAAVDGGQIYGRTHAHLEPDDLLHAVFARCVRAGADLYADVLSQLGEGDAVEAEVQDLTQGREFRAADLTLPRDLRVRWAIRRGLVRDFCASGAANA
jgi:methionyl-tRNA formyltransferase